MAATGSSFVNNPAEPQAAGDKGKLTFKYLPGYFNFLLQSHVPALTALQLQLFRELNIPVFKYFASMPEKEMQEKSEARMQYFLQTLADNKAEEYIATSMRTWEQDQLPLISRDAIMAEDITLISFVRRKSFASFLPMYTSDNLLGIRIMEEIDTFTTETDTRSFKVLISIQQELYRQTQELSQIGNWVMDLATNKLTWSAGMFNIYELPPQREITYDLASLNHPDDAAMIRQQMARSRETLQPHDFYYRIILPDGREKTLHAKGRVLTDEAGKAYRMFGTLQDITEIRRLENDVVEKQILIQKIADLTPSMIAAYNIHTGKYLFINRAIESVLGYSQADVLENGVAFFMPLIHPDDIKPMMEQNAAAIAAANSGAVPEQEAIVEFLYRLKHANGGYRWMQTYGTIFTRNANGGVEEIINISVDVTTQVNTANELKAKHEELEQKNKELESFTYIASHDLQEPLRKIKFFIEQLRTPHTEAVITDYHARVTREATRMQLMINGLLEHSQMNVDERMLEPVDLNKVLDEVKKDLFEVLDEKNGVIDAGPLPIVKGVPLQLHQLFVNLVTNSIKYSNRNVAPRMQVSAERLDTQDKLKEPGPAWKIAFTDNGIGFEEKYAQHIFELFRRLHSKTAYPGTGVGLTICKKIVENHNGIIEAEGHPGKGATFYIYLPAKE